MKDIADKRDYKNRLLEDVNRHGIEYILKIIPEGVLQRHYMCRDWKENKHYSWERVMRLHACDKKYNSVYLCGCKGVPKK